MITNAITTMTNEDDILGAIWFANDWAKLDDETRELVVTIWSEGNIRTHPATCEPVQRAEVALAYVTIKEHAPRVLVHALRTWLLAADVAVAPET